MDCYIFGAGEPSLPAVLPPRGEVLVVAADGGYPMAARAFGVPDLLIGDFDSIDKIPEDVPTLRFPREKDDTDLALAARLAVERGCRRLRIFSALGGRLDHTVANLQLLAGLADGGIEATLHGADGTVALMLSAGGEALFSSAFSGTLSVFAYGGEAREVSLSGLRYSLSGATLTPTVPLGVSNEFLGKEATVSLGEGRLLLLYRSELGELPTLRRRTV